MPIPQPQLNEPEETFIRRCMTDDVMREDYPDARQRLAVCSAQINEDEQNKLDEAKTGIKQA